MLATRPIKMTKLSLPKPNQLIAFYPHFNDRPYQSCIRLTKNLRESPRYDSW
jgi:hypothetical protein